MGKFTVNIASVPDRERVVAEIWLDDELAAEVYSEDNIFYVEFYNHDNGRPLNIRYEDLIRILNSAKNMLVDG